MTKVTCFRMRSSTRSINASGHGSISGALLSVTQARVNSCRSRVSCGIALPSTSAKMSSMSINKRRHQVSSAFERSSSHWVVYSLKYPAGMLVPLEVGTLVSGVQGTLASSGLRFMFTYCH